MTLVVAFQCVIRVTERYDNFGSWNERKCIWEFTVVSKAVKFPKETTPICHHGESIIEVEQISVTER